MTRNPQSQQTDVPHKTSHLPGLIATGGPRSSTTAGFPFFGGEEEEEEEDVEWPGIPSVTTTVFWTFPGCGAILVGGGGTKGVGGLLANGIPIVSPGTLVWM